MDDADPDPAVEEAWEAACEILDREDLDSQDFDAAALAVFQEADRLLAPLADDQSRERRAQVLDGVVTCHVVAKESSKAARVVDELLTGEWPSEALWYRLSAARLLVASMELGFEETCAMAERAVRVGERSDDDNCRSLVAEILKLHAEEVMIEDLAQARALLTRVAEEFGDVDDPLHRAEDRLEDPYFRGRELIERPGQLAAAEAAFRQAVEDGDGEAWLELAVVLSRQPGREDEEARALAAALEAESDPGRLAMAGNHLGLLLHYGKGDRQAAREAFGRATTGTGVHAESAVRELAILAVLEGDQEARRQLIAELAGRSFEEFDPNSRRKDYRVVVALSRFGYARPFIAVRAWRWRRGRRREQREYAASERRGS